MKKTYHVLLAAVLCCLVSVPSHAAGKHPQTGEPLADEQVFTYRLLDDVSSLDPQVVEDVDGASIVRDLFEGLVNQDADGNVCHPAQDQGREPGGDTDRRGGLGRRARNGVGAVYPHAGNPYLRLIWLLPLSIIGTSDARM